MTGKAVAGDHPSTSEEPFSSRYLKVGDNLFVNLPGTSSIGVPVEGEILDSEVLTAAGLEVVDELPINISETKEQQFFKAMSKNFQKL